MSFLSSRILWVCVIILTVFAVAVLYFHFGTPWGYISYKNQFQTYLEEKYGEDFIIHKHTFDMLHSSTYHAYAFPKNNPEFIFYVGQNTRTLEIEDAYHYELWNQQAKKEISPVIAEVYPNLINYSVVIQDFQAPERTNNQELPDYKEMVVLGIDISVDIFISKENEEEELRKIYSLLTALKDKGVKVGHFGIGFQNKTIQLEASMVESMNKFGNLKDQLIDYR
ncbi:hypothetical protein [Peribacillus acanthi]|uniref:hypothetical protein n=1 Tax=Peribacillus acanthi TaxID=2171554 RepID=UPI000D3E54B7|nr:hypothetical protein [Peribacillus acanthi]